MKIINWLLMLMAAALAATPALAQQWPARAVRIIVPYAAGGGTDFTARTVGTRLAELWGQQVVIDNRPGGGTNIGSELAARAVPDGYVLFMGGASNAINMTLYAKPPYDTQRDFTPVVWCVQGANIIAVHPSLPAKSMKELIALAKARPGKLNYASSGLGGSNHMAGELLNMMANINLVHIPYKGNSPAVVDGISGNVEIVISGVPGILQQLQSKRLRGIAISSLERFAAVPDIPTVDESGLKGYESSNWFGLMAPAKVPKEIVARVNADGNRVLASPEVKSRFLNEGVVPKGGTPEAFGQFIRAETAKYADVIRRARIEPL